MQQPTSPIVRQNSPTGKSEPKDRNIRAKSTGTPTVITDNSFLKESFTPLPLTDFIPFEGITNPERNMERLIKAASQYLALYNKKLFFTPTGQFGHDITDLTHTVIQLLPDGQSLNVDYIKNEFVFIVYQSNPKHYWGTIVYLPVSIAHTMRPTIRKLFIRFIAFIMKQNKLPIIKDTYDYGYFIDDTQQRMEDPDEEVDEADIDAMRSYKNKKGKAYRMLQQVVECKDYQPDKLLTELKSLKHLNGVETEQVQCMIRGLNLLSRDMLTVYEYDTTYDNYNNDYSNDDNEKVEWENMICVSWGTEDNDPLVKCHFNTLNDRCCNYDITEPLVHTILSPDNSEKLPLCTFPFEWLNYICDDFYKHLNTNE